MRDVAADVAVERDKREQILTEQAALIREQDKAIAGRVRCL